MGFRSCGYNHKTLAAELGVSEDAAKAALAKSRVGGIARVFSFEDRNTFGSCRMSISKKLEDGTYEPTFQDGYVGFFGGAYDKIKGVEIPEGGIPIVIVSCDVVNKWVKETKKMYTNFTVYDFDFFENNYAPAPAAKPAASKSKTKAAPKVDNEGFEEVEDNDLPF